MFVIRYVLHACFKYFINMCFKLSVFHTSKLELKLAAMLVDLSHILMLPVCWDIFCKRKKFNQAVLNNSKNFQQFHWRKAKLIQVVWVRNADILGNADYIKFWLIFTFKPEVNRNRGSLIYFLSWKLCKQSINSKLFRE